MASNPQLPLFDSEKTTVHARDFLEEDKNSEFGKYIIYVDESGDHGLQSVDKHYPIFALAFCIFHKRHYSEMIVPALEKFKFNYFGHDQVVLHENEIRKEKGSFNIFKSKEQKEQFLAHLTKVIDVSNFILVGSIVDKVKLLKNGDCKSHCYHLALGLCLEKIYDFLKEKSQHEFKTHIVFECRGKKEDSELELEFRRICDGNNKKKMKLPFEIIFSDKKAMSSGLQLADLVARPIGIKYLKPNQDNRAFEVLREKFYCEGGRHHLGKDYEGVGLIIHPTPAYSCS